MSVAARYILKYSFLFLIYFLLLQTLSSQSINYARKIVDTLSSEFMHGRGYVNNGDKIAAKYLANQFGNFKLKHFGKNYFQEFTLDINTFPETPTVIIDDKKLLPGSDFILSCNSGSTKGEFQLLFAHKIQQPNSVLNIHSKIAVVTYDTATVIPIKADAYIVAHKKLTHTVCGSSIAESKIYIVDSLIPPTSKKIQIDVKNKLIKNYKTQNVIGYIPGTQQPDSFIVFSAHYDHLGQLGKGVYFPGANDNASGCAMLLNLVQYYSQHPQKYSIAFMAFGAEEAGLLGSKYYVANPLFPLKQIKFLINLDLLGTGDEGITVVNGTVYKKEFDELVKINEQRTYLPQIKIRGKAANSDHYWFFESGVKCFFIYTLGGISAYHSILDKPETLPLTKFENVFMLLTDFMAYLQK